MNNPRSLAAVFLLAMLVSPLIPHACSSTLALTVFTSKSFYIVTEDIYFYGNLTYHGLPVQDWPVAIEVQDPYGTTVVTRTAQTDTNGEYNLTFRLPLQARTGTYTVYVASSYKGETDTNTTTFELMPRDVAVTNVGFYKNVLGQGYSMNITVTVENQGYATETFNVTAYANETAITLPNGENYATVTLASGESTTVAIAWNTSGFAKGNYTISAHVEPLQGEAETSDNTLGGGWVFVTIPGDVNGNKKVNILDCILIANHFGHAGGDGHAPGSKEWFDCVNCDINSDSKTNVLDCIILSNNFNKSWI